MATRQHTTRATFRVRERGSRLLVSIHATAGDAATFERATQALRAYTGPDYREYRGAIGGWSFRNTAWHQQRIEAAAESCGARLDWDAEKEASA